MLMSSLKPLGELENPSEFVARHVGLGPDDEAHMLSVVGAASRRALIDAIVPRSGLEQSMREIGTVQARSKG